MDILNVKLVWIDGKCYRKLPIKGQIETDPDESEYRSVKRIPLDSLDDEDEYDDFNIENTKNSFVAVLPVPQCLIGFIVGKKHATQKQIEDQTRARIKIPNRVVDGDVISDTSEVVITGETKKSVALACRRISSILSDSRWKVNDYTHFVSVPFNNEEIKNGFLKFKQEILNTCKPSDNITEDMFVKEATLHLTITMLTLLSKKEKEKAKEILLQRRDWISQLLDVGRSVEIRGVEILNDDPSMIDVLYAKVVEKGSNNSLQLIADALSKDFTKINYANKAESVKLHITLMKSKSHENGRRNSFDGRKILQDYSDYIFGRTKISEIHLSVRFTGGIKYYTHHYIMPVQQMQK